VRDAIVFISRNRVLPGKLDGLRAFLAAGSPIIEAAKPRTLALLPYLDASGEGLSIVHVFADAEAFDLHLAGADDRSAAAYEFIAPLGFEVYGPISDSARATFEAAAGAAGLELTILPELPAGFLRLGAAG
jgi:hypothetical protein